MLAIDRQIAEADIADALGLRLAHRLRHGAGLVGDRAAARQRRLAQVIDGIQCQAGHGQVLVAEWVGLPGIGQQEHPLAKSKVSRDWDTGVRDHDLTNRLRAKGGILPDHILIVHHGQHRGGRHGCAVLRACLALTWAVDVKSASADKWHIEVRKKLALQQLSPHRRQGMRILLTNIWMTGRAGSESVTRDLARGLIALGHSPTVYTPVIGQPGRELEASGVPVIDDLRLLREPPDIIHGHHSVPTVEAIVRFPRAPVVNVCHAWAFGVEAPVSFPQVQFHVGVDEVCMERIAHSPGIDPSRFYLVPNGVELKRIPVRPRRLSSRPQKAVAFGKATALLPILLGICADNRIELEAIGMPLRKPVADPEAVLVEADLVFASARAALEALCAGCVVVVCDERGVAGERPRKITRNFGAITSASDASRVRQAPPI